MKKSILSLFFVLLSSFLVAQARLDISVNEIEKEYSALSLVTGYDKDNDYYILVELERAAVYYFFKTKKTPCYLTVIYPLNQGDLNFYVDLYNKQYAIISPTKWRMYNFGGYADIDLRFEEELSYFVWSKPE